MKKHTDFSVQPYHSFTWYLWHHPAWTWVLFLIGIPAVILLLVIFGVLAGSVFWMLTGCL